MRGAEMSGYMMRKIGHELRSGRSWITGKCSGGDRWPDEPHYWIVQRGDTQETVHVRCDDRPSWDRYDTMSCA